MKTTVTNFTALDIGSSRVSVLAANLESNGEARIGYQGIFQSFGLSAGVIKDYKALELSIVNSIYNLEKETDKNITSVTIAISGIGTKSLYIYQKVRLLSGRVTKSDVQLLTEKAMEEFGALNQTIIHYFPIEYTLDMNNSISNPIGMFGNVLGCRFHVVTADSPHITNLLNCFAKCHINVKEIVVGAYASSIAVLTEDEKALGSMVIDFGSSTTSFAIFIGGQLIYTGFVPLGGNSITSDIAKILNINIYSAEKLKVLYGSTLESANPNAAMINLSELDSNPGLDDESNITASDLSMIVKARVEEIVELVKAEYDRVGVDHLISRRIILTGGGSMLRGIKEVVASCFKKQVRVGHSLNIPGFANDHTATSYTAAIGLVKHEMIKQKKYSGFVQDSGKLLGRITSWFKNS